MTTSRFPWARTVAGTAGAPGRGAEGRAGEPAVQRLGEHEHDALRRGLQPLSGRGLGAHVGGVAEGGRRPRERDGEDGGQGEEAAHPAGLRV